MTGRVSVCPILKFFVVSWGGFYGAQTGVSVGYIPWMTPMRWGRVQWGMWWRVAWRLWCGKTDCSRVLAEGEGAVAVLAGEHRWGASVSRLIGRLALYRHVWLTSARVVGFEEGTVYKPLSDWKRKDAETAETKWPFGRNVYLIKDNLPPLSISQRLLLPIGSCCLITPTRSPSWMETSRSWAALKFLSAWKSFSGPYRTRSSALCSSVCTTQFGWKDPEEGLWFDHLIVIKHDESWLKFQLTVPANCFLEVCFSKVFFSKGFLVVVVGGRVSGKKLKPCRSWSILLYSSWNCAIRLPPFPALVENYACKNKVHSYTTRSTGKIFNASWILSPPAGEASALQVLSSWSPSEPGRTPSRSRSAAPLLWRGTWEAHPVVGRWEPHSCSVQPAARPECGGLWGGRRAPCSCRSPAVCRSAFGWVCAAQRTWAAAEWAGWWPRPLCALSTQGRKEEGWETTGGG